MEQQDIVDALNARLMALPGLGDVAWEGIAYEPRPGTPYLSPKLSSYTRTGVGTGLEGSTDHSGTYTVTLRAPAIEGRQPTGQMAGRIMRHFGRGGRVVGPTGQPIILLQASEQVASYFGEWVSIPVVVTFVASD